MAIRWGLWGGPKWNFDAPAWPTQRCLLSGIKKEIWWRMFPCFIWPQVTCGAGLANSQNVASYIISIAPAHGFPRLFPNMSDCRWYGQNQKVILSSLPCGMSHRLQSICHTSSAIPGRHTEFMTNHGSVCITQVTFCTVMPQYKIGDYGGSW